MKYRLQTLVIIILAALLANSFLYAGESVSGRDAAAEESPPEGSVSGGDAAAEENPSEGSVSGGDAAAEENPPEGSVSGGDAAAEENPAEGSVSGGNAAAEERPPEGSVSGGDAAEEENPPEEESLPEEENPSEEESPPEEENPPEESVSAGDGTARQEEGSFREAAPKKAVIFSVLVPKSLDFIMDPYRIGGQGGIWSQEYSFVNKGNTPVKIYLRDIRCTAAEGVLIGKNAESAEFPEGVKSAVLWLDMNNGDKVQITEEASAYEVILKPEEAIGFRVRGEMSVSGHWLSDDLRLSMMYRIETAVSEE